MLLAHFITVHTVYTVSVWYVANVQMLMLRHDWEIHTVIICLSLRGREG